VPDLHVAVLYDGEAPADLADLHPWLKTRAYDVSGFEPVTHEPVVPVMKIGAQQIPDKIQPGAWIDTDGHFCTLAHAVKDAQGRAYMLTAGHCVDGVGSRVKLLTRDGVLGIHEEEIGTVIAFRNQGIGWDFALVRIDLEDVPNVDPAMVSWGGPTGLAETPEAGLVKHYGFGAATWPAHVSRCRTGITDVGYWGTTTFTFWGIVLWGDSGSASNTGSGDALGINTHLNAFGAVSSGVSPFGNNAGTRTSWALTYLEFLTGLDLEVWEATGQNDVCDVA